MELMWTGLDWTELRSGAGGLCFVGFGLVCMDIWMDLFFSFLFSPFLFLFHFSESAENSEEERSGEEKEEEKLKIHRRINAAIYE